MSDDLWQIEPGKLVYRASPGFQARWATGPEVLETIEGLCWSDESGQEEDEIHLYGFVWEGAPPDQERFEDLMREGVLVIDRWVAARA